MAGLITIGLVGSAFLVLLGTLVVMMALTMCVPPSGCYPVLNVVPVCGWPSASC